MHDRGHRDDATTTHDVTPHAATVPECAIDHCSGANMAGRSTGLHPPVSTGEMRWMALHTELTADAANPAPGAILAAHRNPPGASASREASRKISI